MKIRIVQLSMISILIFLIPMISQAQGTVPKQRIIVLVYDDSGSMMRKYIEKEDTYEPLENWKYASYALQSLIALLDENDRLYVIRMSNPESIDEILLNNAQGEMDRIRTWDAKGDTPFQAIETAFSTLDDLTKTYPDAEFWPIVVTDGVVNEMVETYEEYETLADYKAGVETIKQTLETYKTTIINQEEMEINPTLITIESDLEALEQQKLNEFKAMWNQTIGGTILTANSKEGIVTRINEVAALITNRDPNEMNDIILSPTFQGDEIILESPFPLRRITVLEHSTDNSSPLQINGVEIEEHGSHYQLTGPLFMETPDDHDTSVIRGFVTHISGLNREVIEKGTYRINFKETIGADREANFQFIAEPAVDFDIYFYRKNEDGSQTDDTSLFFGESPMLIEVEMVTSDEDRSPIELTGELYRLFEINAMIDDEELHLEWDSAKKRFVSEFILPIGEHIPVQVKTRITGYYQKIKETTVSANPNRTLSLTLLNPNWEAELDKLKNAQPIQLLPMVNGEEITEEELTELFEQFQLTVDKKVKFDIQQDGNTIILSPTYHTMMWLTDTGEIPIQAELEGKYPKEKAQLDFAITIQDIPFWKKYFWPLLILLLIAIIIYFVLVARSNARFKKGSYISIDTRIVTYGQEKSTKPRPRRELLKGKKLRTYVIPKTPQRKLVDNFLFLAAKNDHYIYLAKESQHPDLYVDGIRLGDDSGKRDIQLLHQQDIKLYKDNKTKAVILTYHRT